MERIHIKNFKQIKEADLYLRKFNVIVGEHACGKSTLMKVAYFMHHLQDEIINEVSANAPQIFRHNFFGRMKQAVRIAFVHHFGSTRHLEDFTIDYYTPSGELVCFYINDNNDLDLFFVDDFGDKILDNSFEAVEELVALKNKGLDSSSKEWQEVLDALRARLNIVFGDNTQELYIPNNRSIWFAIGNRVQTIFDEMEQTLKNKGFLRFDSEHELFQLRFVQHIKNNVLPVFKRNTTLKDVFFDVMKFSTDANLKIESTTELINTLLQGTYQTDSFGEKIFYEMPEKYVYLQNASTHQQELIRMVQDLFLAALHQRPVLRFIEHPEAHVRTELHKTLTEFLVWYATAHPENQLVFSTHSTQIVETLNKIIEKGEYLKNEEINILTLDDGNLVVLSNQEEEKVEQIEKDLV
ncbi:AAA family ATPase [Bernardetia sp.]|uniref:AAA family ATPase n=1 Tax=Bernardetia sp. TaxID=1937974 RepID=UPI0025C119A7|nr:AAA family ATPase [Bernardetia sp.]